MVCAKEKLHLFCPVMATDKKRLFCEMFSHRGVTLLKSPPTHCLVPFSKIVGAVGLSTLTVARNYLHETHLH